MRYNFPIGYKSLLDKKTTLLAINLMTKLLKEKFCQFFNFHEINSAFVTTENKGLNDDFNLQERAIDFDIEPGGYIGEIFQSNNKWRRYTLYDSEFNISEGILVDAVSIRRDIYQNSIQSVIVDEIGFDIIVDDKLKSIETLKKYVFDIIKCLNEIEDEFIAQYRVLKKKITNEFNWISAKELKKTVSLLNFNETINKFTQENGLTVIYKLDEEIKKSSLDYKFSQDVFDWNLYALIYVYHPQLSCAINIGYCAFSVDKETFIDQNAITKENNKFKTFYDSIL